MSRRYNELKRRKKKKKKKEERKKKKMKKINIHCVNKHIVYIYINQGLTIVFKKIEKKTVTINTNSVKNKSQKYGAEKGVRDEFKSLELGY